MLVTKNSARSIRASDQGTASTVLDTPTMRRKREQQKQPQDPKLLKLKAVSEAIKMLSFRATALESPVLAVLHDVKNHARDMQDPELAKKAEAKLQRLFSSLTSAVTIAKQHLSSLIGLLSSKLESDVIPTMEDLREIIVAVKQHLPAIQSSLRTLDPKGHHASLVQEIEKQKKFLLQLETFAKREGSNQTHPKIGLAIKGAQSYLLGLEKLADPEFEDRISQSVSRALEQDIPALVKALKSLGDEFRSGPKTASSVRLRKRIQRVAKRIVLLSYLRSKS